MIDLKHLIFVGLTTLAIVGCSDPVDDTTLQSYEREVSAATFDGDWPFASDKGVIGCIDSATYFDTGGGNTYALSGFSNVYSDNKNLGWLPVTPEQPFWLDNPELEGMKVSVSDMISNAMVLCH